MGWTPREIARRVSWDSRLLLFELDPARAHPLERQFARGSARTRHRWWMPRAHLLNSREFDAHFTEVAVIQGKFI